MLRMKHWLLMTALMILALAVLSGCPPTKPSSTGTGTTHEEEGEPPHGGDLFATPDHKFHIELVVNKKENKAEAYVLDGQVKDYVPTKAETLKLTDKGSTPPKSVEFKPEPQKSDPMGQSSHFTATDPLFGNDLKNVEISVTIKDKPYVFTPDKD